METLSAIVVIGLGVAFGVLLLGLIDMIASIPARARANKRRKEMFEAFRGIAESVVKDMERVQNEQATKTKQSRKGTAKTAGSRAKSGASKTGSRSQSGRRNSNTNGKVQSGRKGTSKKA